MPRRTRCLNVVKVLVLCLALFLAALPALAAQRQTAYSGNAKTKKYHNSSCRYFTCKACIVFFASAEEARQKGYIACKVCGG